MKAQPQSIPLKNRARSLTAWGAVLKSKGLPLLTALFLAAGISRAAGDPTYELASSAQVDSSGIYFHQLIKSSQALSDARLCDAPAFGKTAQFTRSQVENLVANASPELATTNWTGADTVTVSRRTRPLTGMEALSLLTQTLQRDYVKDKGDLELDFTETWSPPAVPDEPLTVNILELPVSGVAPSFIIRFELWTPTEMIGTWQASLRAHVWRTVWAAHSNLERGELVSQADVDQERRDVLNLREGLAQFSTDDSSLELATGVSAGNILLARDLKPRTVIHRGQMADARLQDGSLNIMMKVEVLEDGAPGQIIQVRNPVSLRNLSGKVVDEQTIAISP